MDFQLVLLVIQIWHEPLCLSQSVLPMELYLAWYQLSNSFEDPGPKIQAPRSKKKNLNHGFKSLENYEPGICGLKFATRVLLFSQFAI
jgi:hypothetical protein